MGVYLKNGNKLRGGGGNEDLVRGKELLFGYWSLLNSTCLFLTYVEQATRGNGA